MLAVLTLARTTMGFQFQSVASVSPFIVADLGITYAALGTLIGIYLLPGMAAAIPGGWLGQVLGDRRVVVLGLACMTVGGLMAAVEGDYTVMLAGRALAGLGAVFLNVLVTKMVADWFEDRVIVGAMGVLLISWPLGIAIAMVGLGPLAEAMSWPAVMIATSVVCGLALILVQTLYRPPPGLEARAPGRRSARLGRREIELSIWSGLVWTFYNLGFILVLSFGPEYLTAIGYGASRAGAMVSLVTWVVMPSVVIGGFLAERAGRPDLTLHLCLFGAGVAICAVPVWGASVAAFVVMGILFGPNAGLVMGLPAKVLRPECRALGMGIFYTFYYVGMGVGPTVAGWSRDLTGSPAAPLYFAAAMLGLAMISLVVFRSRERSASPAGTQPDPGH